MCLKIKFSKMLLSSGLAICIKLHDGPLGTMSVDTSHQRSTLWGPTRCESDGDRDA